MGNIEKIGIGVVVTLVLVIAAIAFLADSGEVQVPKPEVEERPEQDSASSCGHEAELRRLRKERMDLLAENKQFNGVVTKLRGDLLAMQRGIEADEARLHTQLKAEKEKEKNEFMLLWAEVSREDWQERAGISEERFNAMFGALTQLFPRREAARLMKLLWELKSYDKEHGLDRHSVTSILANAARQEGIFVPGKSPSEISFVELKSLARAGVISIVGESGLERLRERCTPPAPHPTDPMVRINWSLRNKLVPWTSFLNP